MHELEDLRTIKFVEFISNGKLGLDNHSECDF